MGKSKEERAAYQKQWIAEHPEKVKEYSRVAYLKHRDKVLARQKQHREDNPDERKKQNKSNLIGSRFGRLTVMSESLHLVSSGKKNLTHCVCQCDCGTEVEVLRSSLLRGNAKSCGCARIAHLRGRKLRPFEYVYNLLVAKTKKRPDVTCNITYEDFVKFTEIGECHYCGTPVQWALNPDERSKFGYGYHLDRKDNDEPYSKENCVVCCRRCNWGKGDMFTYEEWKKIGEVIKTFPKPEAA